MRESTSALVVIPAAELEALIERATNRAVRRALDAAPRDTAEWLDTAGAAELLGVSARMVTKLVKSGELPASRVGERRYRYRRDDLLAYLERSRG